MSTITIDFGLNVTNAEPTTGQRWGGKRHKKQRRNRIAGNQIRRMLRHAGSRYKRVDTTP